MEVISTYPFSILIGSIITGYFGYNAYWHSDNYIRSILKNYVMSKVNEELDKRIKSEPGEEAFVQFHKNSSRIRITHAGKSHSIYLPYDRKITTDMVRRKVFLIREKKEQDNKTITEKIDISQKPGIPYVVTAAQLGGSYIVIEDHEGNLICKYTENEIPNCF